MPDNHYINPKLAALYDLDSGWGVDRDFYLSLAHSPPEDILDLGCGTGLVCRAYASKGHNVTGADPAAAMLDVGRAKENGDKIEWVHTKAQNFASPKKFDLVIMTGHAFQVLLTDDDVRKVFTTVRAHLKHDGKFVFESRNPAIDWQSKWNYTETLPLPDGSIVEETRHFLGMDQGKMTFDLRYRFADETLSSQSELRFWTRKEIEKHLATASLQVEALLGDWTGKPFEEHDQEMIFSVKPVLVAKPPENV